MTSSASGGSRIVADFQIIWGRKERKKKKKLAARVSASHVFQCEIRFAASKCEMFCGDCGYRSAQKWRGAGGGQSERRATVGQSFYDKYVRISERRAPKGGEGS